MAGACLHNAADIWRRMDHIFCMAAPIHWRWYIIWEVKASTARLLHSLNLVAVGQFFAVRAVQGDCETVQLSLSGLWEMW